MIREQKVESVHQKDAHTQVGMILTPCSVNNCRLVCWCMFQRLCPMVQFLDHVHLGNFLRDSPICSVIVLFFFFFLVSMTYPKIKGEVQFWRTTTQAVCLD